MKMHLLLIVLLPFIGLNVNAQTQLITNGIFSSSSGWITSGNWYITTTKTCYNNSSGYAYAGDANGYAINNETGDLKQTVTIPNTATSATLSFYASKSTDEVTTSEVFDYVNVFLLNSSGSQLMQFSPTNINNLYAGKPSTLCDGYSFKSFSIPTTYFGQQVQVVFRVHTDGAKYTMFRIDDVSLTYVAGASCTSPTSSVNSPTGSSPLTITCTASGSGGTLAYKWYGGSSCSGTVLGTSSTLNVITSGSYSCKAYINGYESTCYNCASGNATITTACSSPTSSVNSPTGSSPLTITCTASGSGGTIAYKWYSGSSCSGTVLGTSSTLSVTTSGNYSCKAYINGFETTCYNCASGYATITTACTIPTSSVNSPTGSNPLTMTCTASGSGGTLAYKWYSGTACSGTVLGTSSTLSVTTSGNYSCKAYINGYESTCYNCATGYATISSSGSVPVEGIDIHGNKTIASWSDVASEGISFAYIKATESNRTPVTGFPDNAKNAKANNIVVGAYHFATPLFSPGYYQSDYNNQATASQEATNFVNAAKNYIGNSFLPPSLDVEDQIVSFTPSNGLSYNVYVDPLSGSSYYIDNSGQHTLTSRPKMSAAALAQWIHDWTAQVFSLTGTMPVLYCTRWYAQQLYPYYQNGTITSKLWIADTTIGSEGSPNTTGWTNWPWIFQQYSWKGRLSPGIIGDVDLDVFNGDLTAFNSLVGGIQIPPPPNDNCSEAKPLTIGTTYNNETLTGATQTLVENYCGSTSSTQIVDVWYKFVATSATHTITATPSSGLDIVIDLRSGNCNGSKIDCKDSGGGKNMPEILTYSNFSVGSTYYIRIYQDGTKTTNDFLINISGTSSCVTPTTQASNITFSDVSINSMTANWTNGKGSRRIVKVNTSNSFTAPGNGTDPTANASYSGSGEQVAYNGTSNSLSVTGLTAGTTYWFRVYEANCSGSSVLYSTTTASNNPNSQIITSSCVAPTTQANAITFSGVNTNSMTTNWANGNGSKRIVKVNTSNSFTAPANGTDPTANASYSSSGEQVVYNGTSNNVRVTELSSGTTYWFRVYEANCTGSSSLYYTDTANNNPNSQSTTSTCTAPNNGIISPSSPTVVAGNGINLTITANGTTQFTYQWWWWNGSNWTALTDSSPYSGTTTQTLTINPTSTSMNGYNYTCVVTNSCGYQNDISSVQLEVTSSCTAPTAQASAITFSGVSTSSMTANWTNGNGNRRVVKVNTSNNFTAPGNGTDPTANASYNGSGEQVVYNGSSNNITVNGLSAGTTYWFKVYEANCIGSSSLYYSATASNNPNSQSTSSPCTIPIASGSITGNNSVCKGGSETYTVPAIAGATSYIWTLPTGATGTSTTNSITVNYGTPAVSGNITVKGHNSCGDGAASNLAITVNALPANAGAITGMVSAYKGTSEIYTVPAIAGATSYIWTLPSGVTGTSTTNSITTTIGSPAASGTIKVKGHNDCGDGMESSLAITIKDLSSGVITGASSVCKGTAETYSVQTIAGATSYIWTLPAGATGSSSTNSINVSFGTNAVSGSIKVKGHNNGGDGAEGTFAITVNDVPSASGSTTGNTSVCKGGSETYTIPAINGATSYIWTLLTGATGTSTTNSITVNYGTTAVSGNITVKGHNSCGDGAASNLAIIVNSKPATPVVTLNANVLHSNASTGNQWYNQNGSINGATNQDYTFTAIGNYSVIVTLNGCASDPSTLNVVTGIDPNESNTSIKVYPNPFTNELTIEFVGNTVKTEFVIVNSKGQVVFSGNLFEKVVIQTSNFSTGLYFVKLNSGKTIEFKKIVKL